MKSWKFSIITMVAVGAILLFGFAYRKIADRKEKIHSCLRETDQKILPGS